MASSRRVTVFVNVFTFYYKLNVIKSRLICWLTYLWLIINPKVKCVLHWTKEIVRLSAKLQYVNNVIHLPTHLFCHISYVASISATT